MIRNGLYLKSGCRAIGTAFVVQLAVDVDADKRQKAHERYLLDYKKKRGVGYCYGATPHS
jgi:hypothetical protein